MKRARMGSLIATWCVAALIVLAANEMIVRSSASAAASDTQAESGQVLAQLDALATIARRDADDRLDITDVRALFERDRSTTCFALAGLFAFKETGIVLVYHGAARGKGGFAQESVPGLGRVATIEEDDCRIRLQVSFDDPPQVETAPRTGERRADRLQFRTRLGGECGINDQTVVLSATAEKSPPRPCLVGTGLFSIRPEGLSLLFYQRRSELPFHAEERVSQDQRNVALVFSAPACRMTLTVEQEVRRGDGWVRLAPIELPTANRR